MQPPSGPTTTRRKRSPAASRLGKESDVLDGFALIGAAGLADPQEVTEATVTNQGLRRVHEHDSRYFVNLTYLVADDNLFKFADLGTFGALQELHLRCNRISTLACSPATFPSLIALDVSFNQIDPHFASPGKHSHTPNIEPIQQWHHRAHKWTAKSTKHYHVDSGWQQTVTECDLQAGFDAKPPEPASH